MKRAVIIAIVLTAGLFFVSDPAEACCGAYYPPVISDLTCSPNELWPPNHKYSDIMVQANVTADPNDPSSPPVDWQVVSVVSDQPDDAEGVGDGKTTNDCYVEIGYMTDPSTGLGFGVVKARAERCGDTADLYDRGRTYTITVQAWARGLYQTLTSTQSCTVYVPHDQSP